jgi:ferritin-like metal-binding protein YciE
MNLLLIETVLGPTTMKRNMNLYDLFVMKLQSLLDIEAVLIKALVKMSKKAHDQELKQVFQEHLRQTEGHAERIKEAFGLLNERTKKMPVDAVRGLASDAQWIIKNVKNPAALDASLIASAHYVEHYEMAGYSTAIEWAKLMGHSQIAQILEKTLDEERTADEKLRYLAIQKINSKANWQEV